MSATSPSGDRETLARTVEAIRSLEDGEATSAVARAAAERQSRLTKPPGSLGRLEQLATRIARITGEVRPHLEQRLIVVAAADHGVAAQGVSAYPAEVTAQMVANFLSGGAAINVLADHAGARVRVVDAGVAGTALEELEDAALLRLDLPRGTADVTQGAAMSRDEALRTVAAGIELVEAEIAAAGVDIVAAGEMGIANSTAAAALVAASTGRPPRSVTGRGTGIDDARFEKKVAAAERALEVNRPDASDGIGLLASIGGFEIGVLAGVYLGAAAHRIPAVVDGVISGAAALVAQAIEARVTASLIAGHRSVEPGHSATLEWLELEPILDLGMRLGEGSGAALAMTVCVAACRLLDEMATFEEASVSDSGDAVTPE
jgi:nicotinate-nucleotide--dimethylbenzimidazole phosphoribosyltransferase